MHDLHGWAPQATQVSNQWRQDGHPLLTAGANVSAGLSPAGSWERQNGMFSPDTGLMRPSVMFLPVFYHRASSFSMSAFQQKYVSGHFLFGAKHRYNFNVLIYSTKANTWSVAWLWSLELGTADAMLSWCSNPVWSLILIGYLDTTWHV